jgi:hypothetical protein
MNTLLTRVANWFEYLGKKTANVDIIDWDEINHMRQRLVQMRFAKPATAMDFAPASGPSMADQSSLKGTFVGANIRSKDRATIRRWNGSKSVFSDSQSDNFDSSGVTVTKYGAPKFAVAANNVSTASVQTAQSTEVRLAEQRSLLRTKLIATNQSMPAYDVDGFALDTAREAELRTAMEQLESSTEH